MLVMSEPYLQKLISSFQNAAEEAVAFSLYDGEKIRDISYRQFYADIMHTAGFFAANGITNQHVALIAPNSYEWIVTFFGILSSSNTAVLTNPQLPPDMLLENCSRADVAVVCCDAETNDLLKTEGIHTLCLGLDTLTSDKPLAWQDIPVLDADTPAMMVFTSGTTGKNKAVVLTHGNLRSCIENEQIIRDSAATERSFLVLPLCHVFSLVCTAFYALVRQNTLCLGRGARYLLQDMPALNPTCVTVVPAIMETMVKYRKHAERLGNSSNVWGESLKRLSVGGASSQKDTVLFLLERGIKVESVFGMTELTGAALITLWHETNIGSLGKPAGCVACRIDEGRLLIKTPAVMKEYYKDPDETALIKRDGWLQTGDLARFDENGTIFLSGRQKNLIILPNGENVNPEEIESALGACAFIEECLVFSDGKGICADVYASNDEAARSFIKTYNEGMPKYRQVYKVNYTAQPLEKTASGKIKRKENR